jgi:hypothetical protein
MGMGGFSFAPARLTLSRDNASARLSYSMKTGGFRCSMRFGTPLAPFNSDETKGVVS